MPKKFSSVVDMFVRLVPCTPAVRGWLWAVRCEGLNKSSIESGVPVGVVKALVPLSPIRRDASLKTGKYDLSFSDVIVSCSSAFVIRPRISAVVKLIPNSLSRGGVEEGEPGEDRLARFNMW